MYTEATNRLTLYKNRIRSRPRTRLTASRGHEGLSRGCRGVQANIKFNPKRYGGGNCDRPVCSCRLETSAAHQHCLASEVKRHRGLPVKMSFSVCSLVLCSTVSMLVNICTIHACACIELYMRKSALLKAYLAQSQLINIKKCLPEL